MPFLYSKRSWTTPINYRQLKHWYFLKGKSEISSPKLFDFYDTIPGRWCFLFNDWKYFAGNISGDVFAFENIQGVLMMKCRCTSINIDWKAIENYAFQQRLTQNCSDTWY